MKVARYVSHFMSGLALGAVLYIPHICVVGSYYPTAAMGVIMDLRWLWPVFAVAYAMLCARLNPIPLLDSWWAAIASGIISATLIGGWLLLVKIASVG